METTWRWFGRNDTVPLEKLRQIGVEGIVTALHDIPAGEVWSSSDILRTRQLIEDAGLRWSVVESLPVSEEIKYAGARRDELIDNYIESLANLGRCGIGTVCYNFMPVLDWVRTDLEHPCPDGGTSLYFDYAAFAYFDIKILSRPGAAESFPPEVAAKAEEMDRTMTPEGRHALVENIIVRTQGFLNSYFRGDDREPVEKFMALLALYEGVGKDELRANMKYFLEAVMPVCNEYGIDMCVHPDDPPMDILGLPRIVRNAEDIRWILSAVPDPRNGLTFCAGSLSSGECNDVVEMAREFAPRTRFVHLRSCELLPGGDFIEAPHTGGRADLVELCRIFAREERRRGATALRRLPMRVDHGRDILSDASLEHNPGYGFYGRMHALGQVEGMLAVIEKELKDTQI